MYTGPHLIKDNLVFGCDTGYGVANNATATRFYPGENTTNLLPSGPAIGTGDFYRQAAHNESFTYSKITNYKGRADVHKLYINPSGNTAEPYADFGGQYHKSGGSAVGDVYALSFDFYVAKGNNPPGLSTSYVNGYKSPTNAGAASLSANNDVDLADGWTRRTRIATIITAGNTYWRFGCNTSGNETEVYIDNVQIELKSHATPFVDGTRSSTQSLIDFKRTTDIDVSNVSFNSTGQPEFDGTDDNLDADLQLNYGNFSVEMIARWNNLGDLFCAGSGTAGAGLTGGTNFNARMTTSGFYVSSYSPPGGPAGWNTSSTVSSTSSTNTTYHITVVNIGTVWYFYKNGTLVGSVDALYTPNSGSTRVGIFRNHVQSVGNAGEVYAFRAYNRALLASEIKQNFNAYKNRFGI